MIEDEQIKAIEEKMTECVAAMRKMAPLVGVARQIKEFSSDQRKNALAAENLARSSPPYLERFKALETSYADACGTIAEWEAVFARFEACRSMLAMARQTLGL